MPANQKETVDHCYFKIIIHSKISNHQPSSGTTLCLRPRLFLGLASLPFLGLLRMLCRFGGGFSFSRFWIFAVEEFVGLFFEHVGNENKETHDEHHDHYL